MLVGLSAGVLDAIYNKNQQQLQTNTLRHHQSFSIVPNIHGPRHVAMAALLCSNAAVGILDV